MAVDATESPALSMRASYRNIPKRKLAWLLLKDTVTSCSEHRIVGMAAEAAFFTLLSLPPLLLGVVGLLSGFDAIADTATLPAVRRHILDLASSLMSERGVRDVVNPLINDLFSESRPDVTSFGFLLALWSGSRAMNVFVGTITVMYGLEGHRNPAATRLLAFLMYLGAMLLAAVTVPAVLIGPDWAVERWPQLGEALRLGYWLLLPLLCVAFLTTLYHVSVPVRSPWREDLPGALVALLIWVLCAYALRAYLRTSVEGESGYGSLAAPVAILLWLGMSAFAILVGAALNAAVDRVWPTATIAAARARTERAREAAATAMVAAVESRRSRAEVAGIPETDTLQVARRWAKLLRPAELKAQLARGSEDERGKGGKASTAEQGDGPRARVREADRTVEDEVEDESVDR